VDTDPDDEDEGLVTPDLLTTDWDGVRLVHKLIVSVAVSILGLANAVLETSKLPVG
jgi:hypothetical protein